MSKKALIVGASGLVGMPLSLEVAKNSTYEKVTLLLRKPLAINHPKIEQKIIDFDNLEGLELKADHVFCCLGTTINKAGSKEAFKKVDYTYPLAIAKIAEKENVELFAIVTAMGANENSMIFYNKVKGATETSLAALNIPHIGIFRPSMLLGDRKERRLGEQLGKVFMKMADFITPAKYKAIHVDLVAKAMVAYASKPSGGVTVIENDAMLA